MKDNETDQIAHQIATSMEITLKNMAVLQESKELEPFGKVTLQADGAMDEKKWVEGQSVQHKSSS